MLPNTLCSLVDKDRPPLYHKVTHHHCLKILAAIYNLTPVAFIFPHTRKQGAVVCLVFYAPAIKWQGAFSVCCVRPSVIPSIHPSVIPSH